MTKVVISVGHTPSDPGAQVNGLKEFDLASKISADVVRILKERKVEVYNVPFDADLATTIDWINRGDFDSNKGDLCVDIHVNDGGESGIEGWYRDRGENASHTLTKHIVDAVAKETALPNLGAKSEYDHPFQKLAFVHNTKSISALIECGFMDHPTDAALLKDYAGIKKFATGIADGIQNFIKEFKAQPAKTQPTPQPAPATAVAPAPQPSIQPVAQPVAQPIAQTPAQPITQNIAPTTQFPPKAPAAFNPGAQTQNRREMVKKLYREVLGKEADMKGISYYMYTKPTITEEQIREEMTQSTEHLEMVKKAKEHEKLKKEKDEQKEAASILRVNLEAKENELANMQKLLQMKNVEIQRARQPVQVAPTPASTPQIDTNRPKGCAGFFRNLFGF